MATKPGRRTPLVGRACNKADEYAATLGIAVDAPAKEVKKVYRKLVRTAHPDKGGDSNAFQNVMGPAAAGAVGARRTPKSRLRKASVHRCRRPSVKTTWPLGSPRVPPRPPIEKTRWF